MPSPGAGRVLWGLGGVIGGQAESPLGHKVWELSFISGPCDSEPCDVDLGCSQLGGQDQG